MSAQLRAAMWRLLVQQAAASSSTEPQPQVLALEFPECLFFCRPEATATTNAGGLDGGGQSRVSDGF